MNVFTRFFAIASFSVAFLLGLSFAGLEGWNSLHAQTIGIQFESEMPSCFGSSDGSLTAVPQNGTPPYSYSWNNGGTTQTITGLSSAIYSVTVTDAVGNAGAQSVFLTQPNPVGCTITSSYETCAGAADAEAAVYGLGGTSPYSFNWSTGDSTWLVSGLTAGTYDVTVTDANDCDTVCQVEIEVSPEGLWLMHMKEDVTCPGGSDGFIHIGVMFGTPPYSYTWDPPALDTPDLSGLPAGRYDVTVTDANGCSNVDSVFITEPPAIVIQLEITDGICEDEGNICAVVSGGTPPYTYAWSNGDTTECIDPAPAGSYTVTITDANGCPATATGHVRNNPPVADTVDLVLDCFCAPNGTEITVSATPRGNGNVPPGFQIAFILSQKPDSIIVDVQSTPDFDISSGGQYTIHAFVYDPATFDIDSLIVLDTSTVNEIFALLLDGGGTLCASLNVMGTDFKVEDPDAGSLTADNDTVCLADSSTMISATPGGDAVVPPGYQIVYVLTQGAGLVIIDTSLIPEFEVTMPGMYTIHTLVYNPNTLDLNIIDFGVTTGFDVNDLLVQGGGDICASLDVDGAKIVVNDPDAGTLTADAGNVCLLDSLATISATPNGDAVVPPGFSVIYVLTRDSNLVIIDVNNTPVFAVDTGGCYTIHTLVYDSSTLDLSVIVFGQTTGADVLNLIASVGACADLDVEGAPVKVSDPFAGTITADDETVCLVGGQATISGTPNGDAVIPPGFELVYVLTKGAGLVIVDTDTIPEFTVSMGGMYRIHPFVYNPAEFSLDSIDLGVTTGFDVLQLIVEGLICADLDATGAKITVDDPQAGSLVGVGACLVDSMAILTATHDVDPNVPAGYKVIYVLTRDTGLVIIDTSSMPEFTVTAGGMYTIHTLVYNPNTLDLSIIQFGVTTGFDVNNLLVQGGGDICAALDVEGAKITVEDPDAGTLTGEDACLVDSMATITATHVINPTVPAGYKVVYVLTQGAGLVITGVDSVPQFKVTTGGMYTIHTLVYDPNTLDLSIVVLGQTTGFDINDLLAQGGGDICGSLDVEGAKITVDDPDAGTLRADSDNVCLDDSSVVISATPNGDANVPPGYQVVYVLTQGSGLVIIDTSLTPAFTVTMSGMYTIHTLVYDPNTLDLSTIQFGVTTGFDVNDLLVQGGGDICASLDVEGAKILVADPDAGTLRADADNVCLVDSSAVISATPNGDAVVPPGYQIIYVLTRGAGLVIIDTSSTPSFTVTGGGMYTIHTLVYDPNTLDLSIIQFGITTGFDVNGLLVQGGGDICASLDVQGAKITVDDPDAGTLTIDDDNVCLINGQATISATPNGDANIPAGYEVLYVLTETISLTIIDTSSTPVFTVNAIGIYTIHTLVYDPNILDPAAVITLGVTNALDVNALLVQGGGDICASLDLIGASAAVVEPDAGTLFGSGSPACLDNGSAILMATLNGDQVVPSSYVVRHLLSQGGVIVQISSAPQFTVNAAGTYRIHTIVYDPDDFDPNTDIIFGTTTINELSAIVAGTCADFDATGAFFEVINPEAGTLTADADSVCLVDGSATLSATHNGDTIVPPGYQIIYVLTTGPGLVILQTSPTPQFTVNQIGLYTIHTLVYDPATLNLNIIIPGVTTAHDVDDLLVQGGGDICASLDLIGAPVAVEDCDDCIDIGDFVWKDVNRDGDQDLNEPGVKNVQVLLTTAGPDGIFGTSDDETVDVTMTDHFGKYIFECVDPGTYVIVFNPFSLPDEYMFTLRNQGTNDEIDSDADTTSGATLPFTIVAGQDDDFSFDAGIYPICEDLTYGGQIGYTQTVCAGIPPDTLVETVPAGGGSGPIEYLWMKTTIPGPFDPTTWMPIPNSNMPYLYPGQLYQTTYFIRCARREGCPDFNAESNIVAIIVIPYDPANCPPPPNSGNLIATVYPTGEIGLNWVVEHDYSGNLHVIESAGSDKVFTDIDQMLSHPSGYVVTQYEYMDQAPKVGMNYYRVRVENTRGEVLSYSNIAEAYLDEDAIKPFRIYPNPFAQNFRIRSSMEMTAPATVRIFNSIGELILERAVDAAGDRLDEEFDLQQFNKGAYLIRIVYGKDRDAHYKVIKIED